MVEALVEKPTSRDHLTVVDLVLIAMIAAAFGAIGLHLLLFTEALRFSFGFYGSMITGGLFQVPGILAGALVRKRWAAFMAQNLFGVTQFLLGVPVGLLVLGFTASEAIGQEVVFRAFRRHMGDWRVWGLAAAGSWICAQVPNYAFYGLGRMAWWSTMGPILIVGIPSSIFFCTFLTAAVVRAAQKSGLLPKEEI
jgi:ABC-type thiamin/hydroxymethylpyrimidine transport system permease subunit